MTGRPSLIAVITFVAGLLAAGSVSGAPARKMDADFLERSPLVVQIVVPQHEMFFQGVNVDSAMAMNLVAGAIVGALDQRRQGRYATRLEPLRDALGELDLRALLVDRAEAHLGGFQVFDLRDLVVTIGSDAASAGDTPAPGVVRLTVEYYLTNALGIFRTQVTAEMYRDVGRRAKPEFFQRVYFDSSAPRAKLRGRRDAYLDYWTGLERDTIRALLVDGIDGCLELLGVDVGAGFPPPDRRGQRYEFMVPGRMYYGHEVRSQNGRLVLRLPNGHLASQLAEAGRAPY